MYDQIFLEGRLWQDLNILRYQFSIKFIGSLSNGGADDLGVNRFEVWHSFDDFWGVDVPVDLAAIDRVTDQKQGFDLRELGKLSDLVPGFDPVVAHVEGLQLDARVQALQLFNLVVGEPKLLKTLPDFLKANNPLDIVAPKR